MDRVKSRIRLLKDGEIINRKERRIIELGIMYDLARSWGVFADNILLCKDDNDDYYLEVHMGTIKESERDGISFAVEVVVDKELQRSNIAIMEVKITFIRMERY